MGLEVFRCYLALLLRRRTNVKIDLFTTQKGNDSNFAFMAELQTVKFGCLRHRSQGRNKVREYVCVFWENCQILMSGSKNECSFFRNDTTVRVDPTFWFLNFLLVA